MTDLNKLAEQIEQAKPEQQREMLELAFAAIFPEPSRGTWIETMSIQQAMKDPAHEAAINAHSHWRRNIRHRFYGILDTYAYLYAALMFLDTRAMWAIGDMEDGPFARLCWPSPDGSSIGGYFDSHAATPALALTAAALRAHAAKGDR